MQLHEKKILSFLISRVFLPGLFKIFWLPVLRSTHLSRTQKSVFGFPTYHYLHEQQANAAAIFKVHHDDFLAQIQLDAYRVYVSTLNFYNFEQRPFKKLQSF